MLAQHPVACLQVPVGEYNGAALSIQQATQPLHLSGQVRHHGYQQVEALYVDGVPALPARLLVLLLLHLHRCTSF